MKSISTGASKGIEETPTAERAWRPASALSAATALIAHCLAAFAATFGGTSNRSFTGSDDGACFEQFYAEFSTFNGLSFFLLKHSTLPVGA